MLQVLLLSVLCGFGLARIGRAGRAVLEGIDGFAHVLFVAFGFIMRLAPQGAFGAMAFTGRALRHQVHRFAGPVYRRRLLRRRARVAGARARLQAHRVAGEATG